jgi:acetyltransferase-like isoleucine patch superfamily enzyme
VTEPSAPTGELAVEADHPPSSGRNPYVVAALERVASLLIAPLLLAHRLRLVSFRAGGQALSLVPGAPGVFLRRAWYGATLLRCGKRLHVDFGTVIAAQDTLIGDNCLLGEWSRVGRAEIGSNFLSGPRICIISGRHIKRFDRRDLPIRQQPVNFGRVRIGEDVWAGAQSTIAADVAAHSIIGAGAVVTKTFPEWSIIAGSPAKVLRERP